MEQNIYPRQKQGWTQGYEDSREGSANLDTDCEGQIVVRYREAFQNTWFHLFLFSPFFVVLCMRIIIM